LICLWVFFGLFLYYPIGYVFTQSFLYEKHFTHKFVQAVLFDPVLRGSLARSLLLGLTTTLLTTLVSLPLAFIYVRYRFRGKGWIGGLILLPMIMPPFVGAIGMKQLFARFGAVNQLIQWGAGGLAAIGLLKEAPQAITIDWFGAAGFWGVVVLQVLHLYPIMYLNVVASLANVDPSMEEAARSLGDSGWRLFRKITFPLMLPGYFAGAIIVFIWAFTDLGTPLILNYRRVVAIQIFDMVTDLHANPSGYALVVVVVLTTLLGFALAKRFLKRRSYAMRSKGGAVAALKPASVRLTALIYLFLLALTGLALLPHLAVVLTSVSRSWFMTVLPERMTSENFRAVFSHEVASISIRNILFYSSLSTLIDVFLGILIAYLLTRKKVPGGSLLDVTSMLPLALPGLVLAFGYVAAYSGRFMGFLDPFKKSPVPLLVISYAVRRLPYMVRAAYAGFQQLDRSLEEASINLGASPLRTARKITIPLIFANLIAGAILCFSFAMLEVSDSLILATKQDDYPIARALYDLFARINDGPYIASALGVLGMVLLAASLLAAGRFLGRRLGELFRAA
jgi:iron(III) transport system permease protein